MATAVKSPKVASFVTGNAPPQAEEAAGLGLEQAELLRQLQQESDGILVKPAQTGKYNVLNLDGLANALGRATTKQRLSENLSKQGDVSRRYQAALSEALKAYDRNDPNQMHAAQTSPFAELRALAADDLKAYRARGDKLIDRAGFAGPARGDDLRTWVPKVEQKFDQGTVVNLQEGGQPSVAAGGWTPPMAGPGGTITQTNTLTGKVDAVDKAPRTNVNLGNTPIAEAMKALPDDYKSGLAFGRTLQNTEQALDALKQGARAGYGEAFLQNARTLVQGLTGIKLDTTTPTAVLAKTLAENVIQEFGGKLGTGVSNADVAFMNKAVGGLEDDPKALERILAIRAGVAYSRLREHNSNVEELAAHPKNEVGEFTRKRYSVEMPNFGFAFSNPDADASFRAIVGNMPLERARALNANEAKRGFGKPAPVNPTDALVKKYLGQ